MILTSVNFPFRSKFSWRWTGRLEEPRRNEAAESSKEEDDSSVHSRPPPLGLGLLRLLARSASFPDFDLLHLLAPDYSAAQGLGLFHLSPVYCASRSGHLHFLAPILSIFWLRTTPLLKASVCSISWPSSVPFDPSLVNSVSLSPVCSVYWRCSFSLPDWSVASSTPDTRPLMVSLNITSCFYNVTCIKSVIVIHVCCILILL